MLRRLGGTFAQAYVDWLAYLAESMDERRCRFGRGEERQRVIHLVPLRRVKTEWRHCLIVDNTTYYCSDVHCGTSRHKPSNGGLHASP